MHIFIDESGSFQSHDPSGVIVFAAIVTNDADRLRRIIRRSRRAKLRTKKEKQLSEIKGTSATDKFKTYFYRQLNNAYFKDSQEDLGIQVADFIAHDTALKYTQENTRWYMLFHDHIKSEMNGADII